MPSKGKGYGTSSRDSQKLGQLYPAPSDPSNEYAHEYKRENTAKGTHPYPQKTPPPASGYNHSHPASGGR